MSNLASILETEVREEIAQIKRQAQEQAAQIVNQAKEQAQNLLESRKRALEGEFNAGVVRAKSAASLEVAALRLSAADSVQKRAFVEAEQKIRDLANSQSAEYRTILGKLIEEARTAIAEPEAVEVNPADILLAQDVLTAAGLSVPVRGNEQIQTGVRLVAQGGRTSVVNTLLGRLAQSRDSLASQVARVLAQ